MEYISGDNIIDYLSYCDNSQLNWLINEIISIIDKFINDCEYKLIDEYILFNKINDIKNKINENKFINNDFKDIFLF